MFSREAGHEARKRGAANRKADLDDIVVKTPPSSSKKSAMSRIFDTITSIGSGSRWRQKEGAENKSTDSGNEFSSSSRESSSDEDTPQSMRLRDTDFDIQVIGENKVEKPVTKRRVGRPRKIKSGVKTPAKRKRGRRTVKKKPDEDDNGIKDNTDMDNDDMNDNIEDDNMEKMINKIDQTMQDVERMEEDEEDEEPVEKPVEKPIATPKKTVRKRERPKKSASTTPKRKGKAPKSVSTPKRRGRPPKSKTNSTTKKRGRPPKTPKHETPSKRRKTNSAEPASIANRLKSRQSDEIVEELSAEEASSSFSPHKDDIRERMDDPKYASNMIGKSEERIADQFSVKVNQAEAKRPKKRGRKKRGPGGVVEFKYRRMPNNKSRIVTVDVIGQILSDFFSKKSISNASNLLTENSLDSKSSEKRFLRFLECYRSVVKDYFDSLVDLQLSNSMIISDLKVVNREKNRCREAIFDVRERKKECLIKLNGLRQEYYDASTKYDIHKAACNNLIQMEGDDPKSKGDDAITGKSLEAMIERRLSELSRSNPSSSELIGKLQMIRKEMEEIYKST